MEAEKQTEKQKVRTARASCRYCYGRGYIGLDQKGQRVSCRCVKVTYVDQPIIKTIKAD